MPLALTTLVAADLHSARRYFVAGGWSKSAVALAFLVLVIGLMSGAYAGFVRAFGFAVADPVAGVLVIRYVLDASFALVLAFSVASFAAGSLNTMFGRRELQLFAPYPIRPETLFSHRLLLTLALASWPVVILGIPAVAALGSVTGGGLPFVILGVSLLMLTVAMIGALGGLASFAVAMIGRIVPKGGRTAVVFVAAVSAAAALARTIAPRWLFMLFATVTPASASAAGERLQELFYNWPTRFVVDPLVALVRAEAIGTATGIFAAAAGIAVVYAFLMLVARRYYLPLWRAVSADGFLARPEDMPKKLLRPRPFPRVFRWRHSFIFEKELLSLLRSPADLARLVFMAALLFVYLLSVQLLSEMAGEFGGPLYVWAVIFAYFVIVYFALTFALRFAFPSFSHEGRSAWVIRTSPVHMHEFFSWKLFFWGAIIGVLTFAAAVWTVIMFAFPLIVTGAFLFAVLVAVLGVVTICLGQGAMYPDFRDTDPDALSTSPAGLAATAIAAVYVTIIGRYLYDFLAAYFIESRIDPLPMFGTLIVALVGIGIYWWVAMHVIDEKEYAA